MRFIFGLVVANVAGTLMALGLWHLVVLETLVDQLAYWLMIGGMVMNILAAIMLR